MATKSQFTEPPPFQQLAQRFKTWRATRPRGQRIPKELWQAAVELAQVHGVCPTATALRLSYYDLQRRMPVQRPTGPGKMAFVELSTPTPVPSLGERGTLEMVHASGARLSLRLPDARPNDLLPLVQLFLRQRS